MPSPWNHVRKKLDFNCFVFLFQRPVSIPGRFRRRDDEQRPALRLQLSQRALLKRLKRSKRSHQKPGKLERLL